MRFVQFSQQSCKVPAPPREDKTEARAQLSQWVAGLGHEPRGVWLPGLGGIPPFLAVLFCNSFSLDYFTGEMKILTIWKVSNHTEKKCGWLNLGSARFGASQWIWLIQAQFVVNGHNWAMPVPCNPSPESMKIKSTNIFKVQSLH